MAIGRFTRGEDGRAQLLLGDGRRVPIVAEAAPRTAGVVLLVDCSSSMSGARIDEARAGALELAAQVATGGARLAVASFESSASLHVAMTADLDAVRAAIRGIEIGSSTNMAEGIALADAAVGEHAPRTIVLVTDGKPDDREAALAAADDARLRDVELVCIGVDGADMEFLRLIATTDRMAMHTSTANLQKTLVAASGLLRLKGRS